MQAVILCGGRGTRLTVLYPDLPKALVPVAGKPFVEWQIERLRAHKIDSITLAAGYRGNKIREWVRQQSFHDRVAVSLEPEPLGTGGALKYLANILGKNSFWTLNGDSLLPELNFQNMEKAHRKSSAWATIAVTSIANSGRYGAVLFDDRGTIVNFNEKQSGQAGWINGGVYLIKSSVLSAIIPKKNVSLEKEVFPKLAAEGKLFAFRVKPPLLDMGTPAGLKNMENYLSR